MQEDRGLLGQIINQNAAAVAFFGAMGGLSRSLLLRTSTTIGFRHAFVE